MRHLKEIVKPMEVKLRSPFGALNLRPPQSGKYAGKIEALPYPVRKWVTHSILPKHFCYTLSFYQIEPYRIFEILWGILEDRTNGAWPSRPFLKNCQHHFLICEWNLNICWAKLLHLRCYESPIVWLNLTSSVHVLIWEDKLDYLKNPSQDF